MSCSVALTNGSKVWLACDNMAVHDENCRMPMDNPSKVFKRGKFLITYAGSFRAGEILRYRFHPPKRNTTDVFKYMCTSFVDAIHRCLEKSRWEENTNGRAEANDMVILVGYAGRIFRVGPDYSVVEPALDFACCGAGEDFASSVMYALKDKAPTERIVAALEAAEVFCTHVAKPFHVMELGA